MSRRQMFLEERLFALRRMLNEKTIPLGRRMRLDARQSEMLRQFVLRCLRIESGDRSAVPRSIR